MLEMNTGNRNLVDFTVSTVTPYYWAAYNRCERVVKSYSDEKTATPTNQIITARQSNGRLLAMFQRESE